MEPPVLDLAETYQGVFVCVGGCGCGCGFGWVCGWVGACENHETPCAGPCKDLLSYMCFKCASVCSCVCERMCVCTHV